MDGTILRNSSYLRRVFGDKPSTPFNSAAYNAITHSIASTRLAFSII